MKRLLKALLVFLIMIGGMPMAAIRVDAAEYVTVTFIPEGGGTPIKTKLEKGKTLRENFLYHWDEYSRLCHGDPYGTAPLIVYLNSNNDDYFIEPSFIINTDEEFVVSYYKPISEIHLAMRWPTAGEKALYTLRSTENSAHYKALEVKFFHTSQWGQYTDKFEEKKPYTGQMEIQVDHGYLPRIYIGGGVQVYLNNAQLDPNKVEMSLYSWDYSIATFRYDFIADKKVGEFVTRMYQKCLGRKPDESGFNNWVTSLMTNIKTASMIVHGFFNSKEFKNMALDNEEFVSLCYIVMFDRSADAGGKKYWLERLTNGVSRNFVLKGFVDGKEFVTLCNKYYIKPGTITLTEPRDQNYNLTSFVARMYDLTLGRRFDVGGLNNWCKKVLDAKDRRSAIIDMAFGFFHSKEFQNKNTSNTAYVKILYSVFFDRKPDQAGWEDWVNKLQAGMSRDQVLLGFANSAEFTNVLKKFKLL